MNFYIILKWQRENIFNNLRASGKLGIIPNIGIVKYKLF